MEKGITIGTGESCSGGLIAKRLTDLPGASKVFVGSIVSYTNEVKTKLLDVPAPLIAQHTPVSAPVAKAMAEGARQALGCDLAVSSTGVAGPGPDEHGNPPGLAFVALAAPEGTLVKELHVGFMTREQVRLSVSQYGLDLVRRYLTGLLKFK